MKPLTACIVSVLAGAACAAPMLDDTPTRVQTTLDPHLTCVGTLRPKAVGEVSASRWTVDCAGTDRENCDWRAMRAYVAPLGIPRIRVQAGWARCEKDPGAYDFAWLDQIVFDAKKMGVTVWLELSYGNPAYPGGGGRHLFDGFPSSPEGLAAWDRWVERLAKRYRGTVRDWCIWNEPDGNVKNDPKTATAFAIRTAEIVKREIPDARLSAFALSQAKIEFVRPFVTELVRLGKVQLFDNIAYHGYRMNPDTGMELANECRAFLAKAAPSLRLFEGEGGTQSEWCGGGALHGYRWTELKQAKFGLRRALGDFAIGDDTSVFHLCDLEYRLNRGHDGLLRYGLLKTQGQVESYRVLKVKPSYYAIQNAVSVFNDALECLDWKTTSTVSGLKKGRICDWRDRKTGTPLVVFWEGAEIPSDDNAVKTAEVAVRAAPFRKPVWCDVLSGNVYRIPAADVRRADEATVYKVPAYDSPAFVTDLALLDLDKSWEVRYDELHDLPEDITIFEEAEFYGPFPRTAKIRTVAEAKAAGVPHRTVRLNPLSRFDLAPLTDKLRAQEEADVAGLLVVRYPSPAAKKAVLAECNDWYGAVAVNGRVRHANIDGECEWLKYDIELEAGDNEVAFWTAPGVSGQWWTKLAVGACGAAGVRALPIEGKGK